MELELSSPPPLFAEFDADPAANVTGSSREPISCSSAPWQARAGRNALSTRIALRIALARPAEEAVLARRRLLPDGRAGQGRAGAQGGKAARRTGSSPSPGGSSHTFMAQWQYLQVTAQDGHSQRGEAPPDTASLEAGKRGARTALLNSVAS